ncbi:hypothetical protein PRZ48_006265 [Zasmidium cellare]|uniref:PLC-like phosphodiesterase n=1 Tax=Zasmidium cellare TaxID=395010 RepID=A0ABR0EMP0_ZASCE|nr:hypothetical protein PRZ48_006265 [Zasmidium cellare]
MLYKSLGSVLFLAGLQAVSAQNSTACNNSPSLCSRQYNNVTYLGAHDSPFLRNDETDFSTSGNQYYNTTQQLASGVRLVTGQIQNPSNSSDLHMCHTSCDLLDAGTLESWLSEIKTWMDANPNDVVTILLVNGPGASASDLAAAYTSSGMAQYAYTPASTSATSTWPTLESMISNGTRAVNFVSTLDDNTDATYLLNEFNYMFENDYNNYNASDFSCTPNRPTNLANQTSTAISSGYMSLVNHFLYEQQAFGISSPNEAAITTTNAPSGGGAGNLGDHASQCAADYGKAPTFLLVDFSNVGPAIDTVDSLNGVSNPSGRTALPDTVLTETSAATIALPQTTTLCLGLGTALLAMVLL